MDFDNCSLFHPVYNNDYSSFCLKQHSVAASRLVTGVGAPDTPIWARSEATLLRLQGHGSGHADDELASIAPPVYFLALGGVRVLDARGMGRCPLPHHDAAYASCQVFAEAQRGWWYYGCARGGRIFDLASLLAGGAWGPGLRGEAFRSARELVAAALG